MKNIFVFKSLTMKFLTGMVIGFTILTTAFPILMVQGKAVTAGIDILGQDPFLSCLIPVASIDEMIVVVFPESKASTVPVANTNASSKEDSFTSNGMLTAVLNVRPLLDVKKDTELLIDVEAYAVNNVDELYISVMLLVGLLLSCYLFAALRRSLVLMRSDVWGGLNVVKMNSRI